jgi:hypothetical protein
MRDIPSSSTKFSLPKSDFSPNWRNRRISPITLPVEDFRPIRPGIFVREFVKIFGVPIVLSEKFQKSLFRLDKFVEVSDS